MRLSYMFLLLIALPVVATAQNDSIRVSGEIETVLDVMFFDKEHPFAPSDDERVKSEFYPILRPNMIIKPVEGVSAVVRAEGYSTDTAWNAFSGQLLEAYVGLYLSYWGRLDIGKKRVEWGRARLLNPINFFQKSINPMNPRSGVEGVPMASISYFSQYVTLEGVGTYDAIPKNWGAGARFSITRVIPETDISILSYWSDEKKLCMGASLDTTPLSGTGILDDLNMYLEYGVTQTTDLPIPQESNQMVELVEQPIKENIFEEGGYSSIIAGLRFSLPVLHTRLLSEFTWQDSGLTEDEINLLGESGLFAAYPSDTSQIARKSLLVGLWQDSFTSYFTHFTDTLGGGVTSIICLEDYSAILNISLESSFIQNFIFSVKSSVMMGKENQQLWTLSPMKWSLNFNARTAF